MDDIKNTNAGKSPQGNSVLAISFDGSRLEGVWMRRPNGSVELRKSFSASLSLDPLTNEPELVGREIRKILDDAGIRERRCAVSLPLKWILTLQVKLPELEDADIPGFLEIEAERGFPHPPETLMLAESRFKTLGGDKYATLVAVPREHVNRLETVLRAAGLRPVTFSLGITAQQGADQKSSNDLLALSPGDSSVALLVTCGGGVAVLRTLEGAFEAEGSTKRIQADVVARETRITLGQLPPEMRDAVRRVRVLGRSEVADELAEQLRPRVEPLGIRVEQVREYSSEEFGVRVPSGVAVTPAVSLALRYLTGRGPGFEFLPPKVSAWKQYTARYGSTKLVGGSIAAGAVVLLILLAFGAQQGIIMYHTSKWNAIRKPVEDVTAIQKQISKYRPWCDKNYRSMKILLTVTEAFPRTGLVSAKDIDIADKVEDRQPVTVVTCNGSTRDMTELNNVFDRLRKSKQVLDAHLDNTRLGTGSTIGSSSSTSTDFTMNFKWVKSGNL